VKWSETRTESSLAVYQGRGQQIEAELALDEDGRMLALRARVVADLGAFLYSTTPVAPLTCAQLLAGPYAIPAVGVEVVGVRTNKVPTGPYRGAGRPEAALALERLVDVAAVETGIDRVELRRRNLVRRFPHDNGLGLTYDSGDYAGALTAALELADYRGLTHQAARARAGGGLAGVGLALFVERVGPGWESAAVAIEADGHVIVRTGASSHGQGHETAFAQIAAEALGVDPVAVEVRSGDSWEIPCGMGTFASRSTTVGGSAILLAARKVHERLAAGETPPLEAHARFELPGPVFSSGAYVAAVTIERSTGEVRVTKIVGVDDCGFVVNPLLAEGQVVGGTVQGIGEALYEQVGYDEDGQPLAVNFHAYRLPTALSVPPITTALRETPSPWNPLGAKGVGEGGSIGTPAAVANAIADALSQIGVPHIDLPFTPARVWTKISQAPGG
jgi:carbon-monoxide dehydrogenase large subunit